MREQWARRTRMLRRLAMSAAAFGAMIGLGGCIHVSQRALANGRTITQNGTASGLVYGRHDLQSQRHSFYRADSYRAQFREVPFPYFGHW